jgi:hypothetical protein
MMILLRCLASVIYYQRGMTSLVEQEVLVISEVEYTIQGVFPDKRLLKRDCLSTVIEKNTVRKD